MIKNTKGYSFFTIMIILTFIALITVYGKSIATPYIHKNKLSTAVDKLIEVKKTEKNVLEQNIKKELMDRLTTTGVAITEEDVIVDITDSGIVFKIHKEEVVKINKSMKLLIDVSFEKELLL